MRLTRLEPSQSKRGGWLLTASNQLAMRKLLSWLGEDEWRSANTRSHSYWVSDQALMRIKTQFTNWQDFPTLNVSSVPISMSPQPRPTTSAPRQHYLLAVSPASSQTVAPATLSQQQVAGFARQAKTFDICLILSQDADKVTLQLARHLPTHDYADIIAALQVLFRQVEGPMVTNPTDFDEELREFLRVILRPIARLSVDPGMLMAEYQRARIAASDGEDRVPDF